MEQKKKTYYISLGAGEISQVRSASEWNYEIKATDDEVTVLREYFDQRFSSDWQGFFRAHVPYLEYHYDRQNDAYDQTTTKIFELIHNLGNDETRTHIEQMGILSQHNE
ncbi:hydrolase [Metabacillus iocasae]|uniref:Hydrolase n=1 Tax=Priestia iocasae TaxID=2291674 RepID=A0ABS2QZB8_9BACI|nr:hydrolase [Metabacillus iocasae]MBM7704834.1 hypothetical protein [Metabacillus iocasae]